MGLSCTVSEINGDFSRKSQIFPTHRVFNAPLLKRFPLDLGTGAGATGLRKMFDDIFIRLDTIHERVGRTDRLIDWVTAKTALRRRAVKIGLE